MAGTRRAACSPCFARKALASTSPPRHTTTEPSEMDVSMAR